MSEIEKMRRYIERTSKRCESRSMTWGDVEALVNNAKQNPVDAVITAFNYGRAKGYRAAKAEGRAKA